MPARIRENDGGGSSIPGPQFQILNPKSREHGDSQLVRLDLNLTLVVPKLDPNSWEAVLDFVSPV